MKARYSGTCPYCHREFPEGTEILHDVSLGWVHSKCLKDLKEDPLVAESPICPECFLSHTGECW